MIWQKIEKKLVIKDDPLPKIKPEVIICIGADVAKDGRLVSKQAKATLDKAVEFWEKYRGCNLILAGGYSVRKKPFSLTEADTMKRYLAQVEPEMARRAILVTESKSSLSNMIYVLEIMVQRNWYSAIIIGQQWHLRRIRFLFRRFAPKKFDLYFIKAWSTYDKSGTQKRFHSFWRFLIWDTVVFASYRFNKMFVK